VRLGERLAALRYRRLLRRMAGPKLLSEFAAAYPRAVFVEIGANDGEQHDHLRPFVLDSAWRGIMVEPVAYVFERLRANYGHIDRIALENSAVAHRDGELPFYHLRERSADELESLPDWYDALGSFSKEVVLAHEPQIPDVAERLRETSVPTLTFESLLAKHGHEHADLVLIDTEGHDWEIIRNIDLERSGPRLLIYEHFHLSRADRDACLGHLDGTGYLHFEEGFDTFALRAEEDDLTRRFRRLRPAVAAVSKEDEAA
jgi:FkbM family methyltransferase